MWLKVIKFIAIKIKTQYLQCFQLVYISRDFDHHQKPKQENYPYQIYAMLSVEISISSKENRNKPPIHFSS